MRSTAFENLPIVGAEVEVYANRGMRPATVLAIRGHQVLIEYRMPSGSSALRLVEFPLDKNTSWCGRAIPYALLSLPWLFEIAASHQQWYGQPQQHGISHPVPTVETLLIRKVFQLSFCTFWRTAQALKLLAAIQAQPGYWDVTGWTSGACGIAAIGILHWVRQSCASALYGKDVHVTLCALSGTGHQAAHVFVTLVAETWELCLDTEGFRRRASLERRWKEYYRLEKVRVVPLHESEKAFKAVHVPFSHSISAAITTSLQYHCGDFPLNLYCS